MNDIRGSRPHGSFGFECCCGGVSHRYQGSSDEKSSNGLVNPF